MAKVFTTITILTAITGGAFLIAPTYQAHETKVYNTYDTEFAELISNINN